MIRQFSIPFNGDNPDTYLKAIAPYKDSIESIFVGVVSVGHNHICITHEADECYVSPYDDNCIKFLDKSRGIYKRVLTLNSGSYNLTKDEMQLYCTDTLFPFIAEYELDAIICTDFAMAKAIHEAYPNVEMQTSCNCFQWTIRQMNIWKNEAGISVFNPPREILRTPEKLKEIHDAGFKIKALINEACLYGCPSSINHCMALSVNKDIEVQCNRGDLSNIFRANWVLPRWLPLLDKYVSIYKISGRLSTTEYIINTLKAYINEEDDIDLTKIIIGSNSSVVKDLGIEIPTKMIPDKLLTCECKECNKTCFVCSNLMQSLNPTNKGCV